MLLHLLVHLVVQTRAGQFFGGLVLLFCVLALPVITIAGLSAFAWQQFSMEARYSKRFGENWEMQYEQQQGPLSKGRVKACLAISAAAINGVVGVWLYRQLFRALKSGEHVSGSHRSRGRKRRLRSSIRAGARRMPGPVGGNIKTKAEEGATTEVLQWNGDAPPLLRSRDSRGIFQNNGQGSSEPGDGSSR